MTDTQETMREEFEQWRLKRMETIRPEDDYLDSSSAWAAWQAAAAQSAEKIARLEAEVEKERKFHIMEQEMRIAEEKKSASAELSNKQLREALELARNGIAWYRENSSEANGCDDEALEQIDAALSHPLSTEALAEYVAKLIPPGWKIVPIEPSQRMIEHANTAAKAANISISGRFESAEAIERVLLRSAYIAMLDAAPLPPAPDKE